MSVRYATGEEKDQIKALWQYAFTDTESFCDYFFEKRYDVCCNLVVAEEDRVRASLLMNPYRFRHGNIEETVRYIVGISVFPEYRGRKYTTSMIQEAFRYAYQNGETLSLLMPIDTSIYRRYGYENCFDMEMLTVDLSKMPVFRPRKDYTMARIASPQDARLADLVSVYEEAAKQWGSYVLRDCSYFSTLYEEVKEEQGEIFVVYDEACQPKGYMIFYPKYELGTKGWVREMLAVQSEVYDCFLSLIQGHATQMNQAVIYQPENSLLMRYLGEDNRIVREKKPFLMARILNVQKVLESLEKSEGEAVWLRVEDPMIEENNGYFELSSFGVRKSEEPVREAIDLSIGELTLLYMGRVTVQQLCFLKSFSYADETVEAISRFFPPKTSYINDYI